jgi:uncharacterized protein (DUF433 family)/antitoxin (DNA-binding transcriptional repressor) of toxin-antitoxin stability system
MTIVKIHEAKTNLSKLIARVEAGEEIIIARDDKPVVRMTAVEVATKKKRVPGSMKGKLPEIPDEFFFEPWTLEPARGGMADEPRAYTPGGGRITIDPDMCGGRPCIRGMRIRVSDVVGLLAGGTTREQLLADYPYLEAEDIDAALAYAAGSSNHRVIQAT